MKTNCYFKDFSRDGFSKFIFQHGGPEAQQSLPPKPEKNQSLPPTPEQMKQFAKERKEEREALRKKEGADRSFERWDRIHAIQQEDHLIAEGIKRVGEGSVRKSRIAEAKPIRAMLKSEMLELIATEMRYQKSIRPTNMLGEQKAVTALKEIKKYWDKK